MGRNTRNFIQYFLTLVLFTFCTYCILRCIVCVVVSCLVCVVVSCLVCVVVVVLCVLLFVLCLLLYLSCVYCCNCLVCTVVTLCVFFVLCVYCCFYFRRRTAGQKSEFGRSCDRPPRHRFFFVSLCLKADAEMVPKIPSCHYMLLM